MRSSSTPAAYFAISEQFDYREYLERRSHFDRIEFAIDRQAAELVGGLERLTSGASPADQNASNQAQRETRKSVEAGFREVNKNLSDISQHTARVSEDTFEIKLDTAALLREAQKIPPLLEWGFSSTLQELVGTNERLDRIAYATENTDQAWAYSQYKTARTALFESGLVPEAFDYVTRAIEGYRGRVGYPLEPNFYLLRGSIRLGILDSIDLNLVDIDEAIIDFEKAARYSRKVDVPIHARSLAYLGRAHYCKKQLRESVEKFRLAANTLPEDGHIQFNLAKSLVASKQIEEAKTAFAKAIRRDYMFANRALADADFRLAEKTFVQEVDKYRQQLVAMLTEVCNTIDFDSLRQLVKSYEGHATPEVASNIFEKPGAVPSQANHLIRKMTSRCPKLSESKVSELVEIKDDIFRSRFDDLIALVERDREVTSGRLEASEARRASTLARESENEIAEIEKKYIDAKTRSEKNEGMNHGLMFVCIGVVFIIWLLQLEASWRLIYQVPLAYLGSTVIVGIPFITWAYFSEHDRKSSASRNKEAVENETARKVGEIKSGSRNRVRDGLKKHDSALSQLRTAGRILQKHSDLN